MAARDSKDHHGIPMGPALQGMPSEISASVVLSGLKIWRKACREYGQDNFDAIAHHSACKVALRPSRAISMTIGPNPVQRIGNGL